jgi:hypothetical protein
MIEPLEAAGTGELALGLPPGFLANKCADGDGPRFYRLGRRTVRYRRSETPAWITSCEEVPERKKAGER